MRQLELCAFAFVRGVPAFEGGALVIALVLPELRCFVVSVGSRVMPTSGLFMSLPHIAHAAESTEADRLIRHGVGDDGLRR